MRSLLFSTLYPSQARSRHGLFVEKRALELVRHSGVSTRVVAPVPWFPWRADAFGSYATFARTPEFEIRNGLEVHHPRYLLLPKVSTSLAPLTLAWGALGCIKRLLSSGFDFDVIDAHYMYPDGVAAVLLGQWLGKPVTITARGSDINVIAELPVPRAMIRWAARNAFACIGVSTELAGRMEALGAREVHVMRNGVDCSVFRDIDPVHARRHLGLSDDPLLLTVGNLVPLKRQAWIVRSLAQLVAEFPRAHLAIVGSGDQGPVLSALAQDLGLGERVRLVGPVAQDQLSWWYSAADVSVLASEKEGWPNVLLESMACGTPVVASRVGGVPEIIDNLDLGRLFVPDRADALTAALRDALHTVWDRRAIRGYAQNMGWDETSQRQAALFARATGQGEARGRA